MRLRPEVNSIINSIIRSQHYTYANNATCSFEYKTVFYIRYDIFIYLLLLLL